MKKILLAVTVMVIIPLLLVGGAVMLIPDLRNSIFPEKVTFQDKEPDYWAAALRGKKWDGASRDLIAGKDEAVPVLRVTLMDRDPKVRWRSARVLSFIRSKEARPELLRGQKDAHPTVQLWSAYALAVSAPDEKGASIALLFKGVREQHPELKAKEALQNLSPEAKLDGLISAVKSKNANIRMEAMTYLGEAGSDAKPAIPAILAVLRDRNLDKKSRFELTDMANATLDKIDPMARKNAVKTLIEEVKDPNSKDRAGAAHALGGLGPIASDAVDALVEVVKNDKDPKFAKIALSALAKIDAGKASEVGGDLLLCE